MSQSEHESLPEVLDNSGMPCEKVGVKVCLPKTGLGNVLLGE